MVPILEAAEDPELSLRDFARGVRVGPGAWVPKQLAPEKPKRPSARTGRTDSVRLDNNSSLSDLSDNVVEAMENQEIRAKS